MAEAGPASESATSHSVPGVGQVLQNTKYGKEKVSEVVDNYVDFFDESKGGSEELRKENYETVVDSYYALATDMYEYGWGQSFHFAAQAKGEPYKQAIARHEHFLALKLQVNSGEKLLDCGCGVGGPAREIARLTGCHITGLNLSEYQMQRANKHTEDQGMTDLVSFQHGNFMEIPADDCTYDGIYAIEATCHAPNKRGVYSQVFRALKPGRIFSAYEWCMTDLYDSSDPEHRAIKLGIEEGDGIPDLATTREVIEALKDVGFEVLEFSDLAIDACAIPWYTPLDGTWSISNFRQTKVGRWCTHKLVSVLEFVGLAPKGIVKMHDFLIKAADNLVAGGKTGIFTPMFFFVARKPEC